MLSENLQQVEDKIADACKRAKRERSEVTLIAVSKTKPISMLQEIYNEGIRCFGENKVQELTEKYEQLPSDIKWHMIGHLQRNKVKYIINKTELIHSVDSLRLVETINQEALRKDVIANILIEVNDAEEERKKKEEERERKRKAQEKTAVKGVKTSVKESKTKKDSQISLFDMLEDGEKTEEKNDCV